MDAPNLGVRKSLRALHLGLSILSVQKRLLLTDLKDILEHHSVTVKIVFLCKIEIGGYMHLAFISKQANTGKTESLRRTLRINGDQQGKCMINLIDEDNVIFVEV